MEPGSIQISSTKDLQTLYPNSFDRIGNMSGEYDIKIDPSVPPVQHGRCKVPIEYKAEIEKELNDMVQQGIIANIDRTDTMGKLTDIPKETQR